jgi:hypothetical protein
LQPAAATAQSPRPALQGVSSVRIANYGAPSVLLEGRDKFGPIVGELNALRKRPWRGGDTRQECYSTVVVYSGKKTLATFRVRPDSVVEREGARGVPVYSLGIGADDIPQLTRHLADIVPAKDCS